MAIVSPTYAGFLTFVRQEMGINTTILPDNSYSLRLSFAVAMGMVNTQLARIPQVHVTDFDVSDYPSLYAVAVYNFGGHWLVNVAPDVPGCEAVAGTNPPLCYFANLRKQFNLTGFTSGIVTSTSDEGTSVSMQVPEWASNMTLQDMNMLKTPWGQAYMAIAQSYGPSVWGLTP